MPKAAPAILSFASGEWSPLYSKRIDYAKYLQGCTYARNALPTIEGPTSARPGMRYVVASRDGGPVEIIPWVRSKDVAYVAEFGDGYCRLVDEDGALAIQYPNSFDADTAVWATTVVATGAVTATDQGNGITRLAGTNPAPGDSWTYKTSLTGLDPSTEYSLSCEVRQVSFAGVVTSYYIGAAAAAQFVNPATSAWGTFVVLNAFADVSGNLEIGFACATNSNDTFEFRNIVVRKVGTQSDGLASPYTLAQAKAIQWAQSFDVLFMAHPDVAPQRLSRYAATLWDIDTAPFVAMPAFGENTDQGSYIIASGASGSVTLTAINDIFNAGHVGSQFILRSAVEAEYQQWIKGTVYGAGARVWYASSETPGRVNVYETAAGGTAGDTPPSHDSGIFSDGAVSWQYAHTSRCYAKITGFSNTRVVTASIIDGLVPSSYLSGTEGTRWSEAAWSDYRGWPRCIAFYENRIIYASTVSQPFTLWGSAVDNYYSFDPGFSLDTDAYSYTINDARNAIAWLSASDVLEIGTEGNVFVASGAGDNAAITPTNIKMTRASGSIGGYPQQPTRTDDTTVFVQRGRKNVRDFFWKTIEQAGSGIELSQTSRHIAELGIGKLFYTQSPESRLWTYADDGQLISCIYNRQAETVGWNRHDVSGSVRSMCVIPSANGDSDFLWTVTERSINGSTVYYLEVMDSEGLNVFLDSYATKTYGTETTAITGYDHLEGETVNVVADGASVGTYVVSSGGFTLSSGALVVTAGKFASAIIDTQDIEAGSANGVSIGKQKRIHDVAIALYQTGPGVKIGQPGKTLDTVTFRSTEDNMGESVPLYTGTMVVNFPGGWSTDVLSGGIIRIEQTQPLPFTLLGLCPTIDTQDAR